MIHTQRQKVVQMIAPTAIKDNASWTSAELDCKGWDHCTIYVMLGATDIAMAALKIRENDATGTGQADVTGLIFGTSTNDAGSTSTLPAAGDDNDIFAFDIDLRYRKRFLDIVATAGDGTAGTYLAAWAVLERGEQVPNSAAERGLNQCLRV